VPDSLEPDVAAFLALVAQGPKMSFRDMAVDDAREAVREMGAAFDAPADLSVAVQDAACRVDGRTIQVRCYTPPECRAAAPAMLFLHGGGWVAGDIDGYDSFCRFLARRSGLRVASVDYRRAPETPFPGAVDDALCVARWLAAGAAPIGVIDGLVLAGDSAGGGIATALAGHADTQAMDVRGLLLFYPVLDVSRRAASYAEFAEGFLLEADDMAYFIASYVPDEADRSDPRCSPLLHFEAGRMPPVALLTCGYDVLRDEGRAYAEICRAAGLNLCHVEAPGHIHGIVTLRKVIPSGVSYIERVIDELLSAIGST